MKYSIAMAIRVVCIIVAVFLPGWWRLIPIVGAVFLPYFAVVIANAQRAPTRGNVEAPGAVIRYSPQTDASSADADESGGAESTEPPAEPEEKE